MPCQSSYRTLFFSSSTTFPFPKTLSLAIKYLGQPTNYVFLLVGLAVRFLYQVQFNALKVIKQSEVYTPFVLRPSISDRILETSGFYWDHLGDELYSEAPSVGNGCLRVSHYESNYWCESAAFPFLSNKMCDEAFFLLQCYWRWLCLFHVVFHYFREAICPAFMFLFPSSLSALKQLVLGRYFAIICENGGHSGSNF